MKLNIDTNRIRLRLSEDELEQLIDRGSIEQVWNCPDGSSAHCALRLKTDSESAFCGGNMQAMHIDLPRERFLAFAAERPRRDGFAFDQEDIRILIDIDVRDSHRRRAMQGSGLSTERNSKAGNDICVANDRHPSDLREKI